MAWEWVGPAVTGLVGVAGITGTFWASRQSASTQIDLLRQQHLEDRRAELRTDRRRLYSQLLGDLNLIATNVDVILNLRPRAFIDVTDSKVELGMSQEDAEREASREERSCSSAKTSASSTNITRSPG